MRDDEGGHRDSDLDAPGTVTGFSSAAALGMTEQSHRGIMEDPSERGDDD